MASYTKTTKHKRKVRAKKMGRDAAAKRERDGTTPVFPVHTAAADANRPAEAKPTAE